MAYRLGLLVFLSRAGMGNRAGTEAHCRLYHWPCRVVELEKVGVLQVAEQGSKPFVYKV